MKRYSLFDQVFAATTGAIILVLALIPNVGYWTFIPGAAITIVHIPVLIAVFLLPKKYSWYPGVIFGLSSLFAALLFAASPMDVAAQMPWISILPRVVFTVIASFLFAGLRWLGELKNGRLIMGITSLVIMLALASVAVNYFYKTNGWHLGWLIPVGIIVPIGLSVYYFYLTRNKHGVTTVFPAAFMLCTLIHAFLYLFNFILFDPQAFRDTVPSDSLMSGILAVVVANSMVESILATLIGTPIITALWNVRYPFEGDGI